MQGLGGLAPGLNRGATMSGNKDGAGVNGAISGALLLTGTSSATTGSVTATADGWAYVYAIGAGGRGSDTNGGATGGGAGAAYRKVAVRRGDTFTVSAAKSTASGAGDSSTVTCPDGRVVAGGGGTSSASGTPGAGGVGTGGDINRRGGDGATGVGNGNVGPDPGGGTAGVGNGSTRAGGSASAGFGDHGEMLIGGDGGDASDPPTVPGGGAGANSYSGAAGRVFVLIVSGA